MPARSIDIPGKGKLVCLKCSRPFISWDRRKNRLCKKCQESNESLVKSYFPEALGIANHTLNKTKQHPIPD
jgi:hypothetical protein